MKYKVSIIIPIYNVSQYIVRCLNSVVCQTYQYIECILVDDCSLDDSISKCQKIISEYKGTIEFKILHHEKNRGLSAARNTGTEAAIGDYVYYLDSDDEIKCNCIELLVSEVYSHPEVQIVMGATESIPYKEYYDLPYYKKKLYVDDNNWVRYNFYKKWPSLQVNAWNKLIDLKFVKDNSLFFLEGIIHEDELWMFFVSKKLSKLVIIPEKTYVHYYTPNSIMGLLNRERSAINWGIIIKSIINNFDSPMSKLQMFKYMYYYFLYYDVCKKEKTYRKLLLNFSFALLKYGYLKFAGYLFLNYIHEYRFSYSPVELVNYYWEEELSSGKYSKYSIIV